MMQTQRALGDVFSELSQKNPELREEFTYNSETQRVLCRNGETLLGEFATSWHLSSTYFLSHPICLKFLDSFRHHWLPCQPLYVLYKVQT